MTPHQWLDQALAEAKAAGNTNIVDNLTAGLVKYCKASRHDIVDYLNNWLPPDRQGQIELAINQVGWHDTVLAACAYRLPTPLPPVAYRDNPNAGNDAQTAFLARLDAEGLTMDPPPPNTVLPLAGLFAAGASAAIAGDAATVDHLIHQLAAARGIIAEPLAGMTLTPPSVRWVVCPKDSQTGPTHYDPFMEQEDRNPDDASRPWSTVIEMPVWFEGVPSMIVQAKLQGVVADDPIAAVRRPDPHAEPALDTDGCLWFKAAPTTAQWEQILRSLVTAPGFGKLFPDWKTRAPKAASRIGV